MRFGIECYFYKFEDNFDEGGTKTLSLLFDSPILSYLI
jgi:hypothetical protein